MSDVLALVITDSDGVLWRLLGAIVQGSLFFGAWALIEGFLNRERKMSREEIASLQPIIWLDDDGSEHFQFADGTEHVTTREELQRRREVRVSNGLPAEAYSYLVGDDLERARGS